MPVAETLQVERKCPLTLLNGAKYLWYSLSQKCESLGRDERVLERAVEDDQCYIHLPLEAKAPPYQVSLV